MVVDYSSKLTQGRLFEYQSNLIQDANIKDFRACKG